ncbi:unnamed protein product [Schistosoma margrebowiei]|uniref:BZIP domain-containing protein n=1 Tax=Schistosoma margrebowiei TaxID=48269 RepID=A0AA85AKQ1_9TREM|nr:unnamed protein product [Schistosoma margrebowiei]
MATLYTGNNHVIDTSLVSKTLRKSTSTTTTASIPVTTTIITASTQISEVNSSKQIKNKSIYPSTPFSPNLVDHHHHHQQSIDLMSNPNGGLALASALAGILGLPFLPSILPPTSLNPTTMTMTTTAATSGIETTIPSSILDKSPSDITTFLSQHQQTQPMLPLWLPSNYQNNNENVDILTDNLITNTTNNNNNNTLANVCCKNSNGQITDTLGSSGINLNISTMNTIHSMNSLYDNINSNNNNNNAVTNSSNNSSHLFNNFSFILPSQQTCSDVSSDTGSVQSPFTPVQQTTQSTSIHLTNSNAIDSIYSSSNPNNKFNAAMLSSIMTSSSSSATTTPIPVTSQQNNLDSSINNSLLNSIERDRKQREFIPDSKKDDKYWERRRKNNEAAKRSREKRRQNDILMECRINQLQIQNHKLHHELIELKLRFNIQLNDEDKKFMENQSSTLDDTQNDVYNEHHDHHHNNSDGELKLSEMDCCMMSTTKSRNDSLSMDDSQNEMLLKSDQLSSVSPTPPPLLPQSPTTTTMLMTMTTATATTSCTAATVLPVSASSIDPLMNSMVMTTTSSSSSSPLLLQSLNRMNCEQQMNIELTATNTTSTTSVPSNNHNHTVSNNFLFPQLNSLDNTDLLTLKRIFSSLGVGCLSTPPTTSSVTMNYPSSTSSASPLIAAAAAAAAVAAVATNGGCTMPLSPISGNNNNSVCTNSTTAPFNNLSSLNTTAALLLRQAGLMPASTTPPPPPPPLPLQSTLPIPQHHQTTSCGLHDNISVIKNNKNDKLSFSSSVIPLTAGPAANVGGGGNGGGRCSSVHSVKSDLSNNSNDYFESPLDLSLCLQIKSESHNSEHFLSDSNSGTSTLDKRYQDRRRRNNEAVRRCRENKRARLLGRTETTEKLQSENRCLRNELSGLSMEVKALRKLLTVGGQQQDQHENTTAFTTKNNNCMSRNASSNGMDYFGDNNEIKLFEETTTTILKHDQKEVPSSPTSSLSPRRRRRPPPPPISIPSSNVDNEKEVANTVNIGHETEMIETMNDNNIDNTDDDIEMPTLTTMNVDSYSLDDDDDDDDNSLRSQTHTDHRKKLSSNITMETSSSNNQINKNVQVLLPNEHSQNIDNLSQEKLIHIAQMDTDDNTNDTDITTTNTTNNENISSFDSNKIMDCTKSDNGSRCGVDVGGNSISIAVTNTDGTQSTELLTHVNKNVNDKPTTVILRGRRRTLKTPIHNKNAKTNINHINHHHDQDTTDTINNVITSSITQTTDLNDASNTSNIISAHKQHTPPSCNTATNIISSNILSKSENSYILPDKSTYFQLTNEYSTRNSGKEDSILT